MTTFGDQLYHLGGVPLGFAGIIPPGGTNFFLDPANGSDDNDGRASDRGVLMGNMDAVTGADASGLAVELIT